MKIKESIFDILRIIARDESSHPRVFMSAAIVKNNRIIAVGTNRMDKTDSFQLKFGRNSQSVFLHAEVCAIKNALKIVDIDVLKKCNLYICRLKYDSTEKNMLVDGLSKPCIGCMRAIRTFELKNVIYTTNDINDKYGVITL